MPAALSPLPMSDVPSLATALARSVHARRLQEAEELSLLRRLFDATGLCVVSAQARPGGEWQLVVGPTDAAGNVAVQTADAAPAGNALPSIDAPPTRAEAPVVGAAPGSNAALFDGSLDGTFDGALEAEIAATPAPSAIPSAWDLGEPPALPQPASRREARGEAPGLQIPTLTSVAAPDAALPSLDGPDDVLPLPVPLVLPGRGVGAAEAGDGTDADLLPPPLPMLGADRDDDELPPLPGLVEPPRPPTAVAGPATPDLDALSADAETFVLPPLAPPTLDPPASDSRVLSLPAESSTDANIPAPAVPSTVAPSTVAALEAAAAAQRHPDATPVLDIRVAAQRGAAALRVPGSGTRRRNPLKTASDDLTAVAQRLAHALVSDIVVYSPEKHAAVVGAGPAALLDAFGTAIEQARAQYHLETDAHAVPSRDRIFATAVNDVLGHGQVLLPDT